MGQSGLRNKSSCVRKGSSTGTVASCSKLACRRVDAGRDDSSCAGDDDADSDADDDIVVGRQRKTCAWGYCNRTCGNANNRIFLNVKFFSLAMMAEFLFCTVRSFACGMHACGMRVSVNIGLGMNQITPLQRRLQHVVRRCYCFQFFSRASFII
jgi:hypothetical protein